MPPAMAAQVAQAANKSDVRQVFIAKSQPVLDSTASVSVLAASSKKLKPEVLLKELDRPSALVFAKDGTLYFIGDHDNAIVAIYPNNISKIIATSGIMSYVTPDGKTEPEPLYNTFEELNITPEGNLLTLRNGAYPFEINTKTGEMRFLGFVLPSGEAISEPSKLSYPVFKNYLDWELRLIQSDAMGRTVVSNVAAKDRPWYRYQENGMLEVIKNPLELPPLAYMVRTLGGFSGSLAPDGYIYAVEEGKHPNDPDRVIRIGDSGLSSLRKNASRVVIAEFKHGDLTGALAFSPKGDLAVGAKNAIYLISPPPAK